MTLESLMVSAVPNETLPGTLISVLDISFPKKMWFSIHLGTITICACLPTYGKPREKGCGDSLESTQAIRLFQPTIFGRRQTSTVGVQYEEVR